MLNSELLPVPLDQAETLAEQLRHQLTLLGDKAPACSGTLAGMTIWSTANKSVTVYWSWQISDEGWPLLADPLSIRSNLQFGTPGQGGDFDDQLVGINRLVHALPWQSEVKAYLARLGLPGARIPERQRRTATARQAGRARSFA